MNNQVLIADDEDDVLKLVSSNLKSAGFKVIEARNGSEALEETRKRQPALIVLDWMLPDLSGIEVCKLLKGDQLTKGIPIVMLTAKTQEIDRIIGLEVGADDYVIKPFSPRELVLRVKSHIRRSQAQVLPDHIIQANDITLDVTAHSVKVDVKGKMKAVELTPTEFKLLALLMSRPGRVQSRDGLLSEVWGYEVAIASRTVDIRILRLRDKLGKAGTAIETVRGFGYRFAAQKT
jgi:two-component system, OmpR family, phosphate regulon response regulator PhoB